jgi:hypothetical protein
MINIVFPGKNYPYFIIRNMPLMLMNRVANAQIREDPHITMKPSIQPCSPEPCMYV